MRKTNRKKAIEIEHIPDKTYQIFGFSETISYFNKHAKKSTETSRQFLW